LARSTSYEASHYEVMPPQWTAASMDDVENVPLPALEEANFEVLKLKNNRA
jgi:hypothetical protein